ncbi:hypothetical protein [Parasphingorhabdus sp. NYA22]
MAFAMLFSVTVISSLIPWIGRVKKRNGMPRFAILPLPLMIQRRGVKDRFSSSGVYGVRID